VIEPYRPGTRERASRRSTSLSIVSACLVAIALAVLPVAAQAKAKRHHAAGGKAKRIAITSTDGGGAPEGPVRAQLTKVLKKSKIKVVSSKKGGAPTDDQQWVALGQKLKVDGFVQLTFEAGHGKRTVEISVRNGADGSALGSETFTAKGTPARLAAAVGKNFWKKLGAKVKHTEPAKASETTGMPARDLAHEEPATTAAAPAAAVEPETPSSPEASPAAEKPAAETPAPAEVKPAETSAEADGSKSNDAAQARAAAPPASGESTGDAGLREPALTAVVQVRYLHRSFTYTPSTAAPSGTTSSPTVGAEVAWFPLPRFGLAVGGEAENWAKELGRYPTLSSDIHASLVFRYPLSFGELYLRAGGFRHFFAITDDSDHTRQNLSVPDVVYTGVRAGGALAIPVMPALSVTVAADYRLVTDLNGGGFPLTSQAYFPRATPGPAFDGAVTLAFRIAPLLDLQAGGDIRRYVMALGGQPGNRINASGATDLYLAGWIGIGGAFGGS